MSGFHECPARVASFSFLVLVPRSRSVTMSSSLQLGIVKVSSREKRLFRAPSTRLDPSVPSTGISLNFQPLDNKLGSALPLIDVAFSSIQIARAHGIYSGIIVHFHDLRLVKNRYLSLAECSLHG